MKIVLCGNPQINRHHCTRSLNFSVQQMNISRQLPKGKIGSITSQRPGRCKSPALTDARQESSRNACLSSSQTRTTVSPSSSPPPTPTTPRPCAAAHRRTHALQHILPRRHRIADTSAKHQDHPSPGPYSTASAPPSPCAVAFAPPRRRAGRPGAAAAAGDSGAPARRPAPRPAPRWLVGRPSWPCSPRAAWARRCSTASLALACAPRKKSRKNQPAVRGLGISRRPCLLM
jgi:hypothetical protein